LNLPPFRQVVKHMDSVRNSGAAFASLSRGVACGPAGSAFGLTVIKHVTVSGERWSVTENTQISSEFPDKGLSF
jgi:hypothetical protein